MNPAIYARAASERNVPKDAGLDETCCPAFPAFTRDNKRAVETVRIDRSFANVTRTITRLIATKEFYILCRGW